MFRTEFPANSEGISGRDLLSLADQTIWTAEHYVDSSTGEWSQLSPASPFGPSPFGDIGFLNEGLDPLRSFKLLGTNKLNSNNNKNGGGSKNRNHGTPKKQTKTEPSLASRRPSR